MGKQKLSDMVADNILKMIQEQQYDTDGFLPSEGKLLEKFEVSRITVREAVRTLEVRGFVRRIHGKGIQVVDNAANVLTQLFNDMIVQGTIAQDDMSTLNELLEIRTILEPKCAEMAAERRTKQDIEKLQECIDIMEKSKVMDDAYYEADLSFHILLAGASGNSMLHSLIKAYTSNLKKLIVASSKAQKPIEQNYHYHRNILEAVIKQDKEAAFNGMQTHLVVTKENKDTMNQGTQ